MSLFIFPSRFLAGYKVLRSGLFTWSKRKVELNDGGLKTLLASVAYWQSWCKVEKSNFLHVFLREIQMVTIQNISRQNQIQIFELSKPTFFPAAVSPIDSLHNLFSPFFLVEWTNYLSLKVQHKNTIFSNGLKS